MGKAFGWKPFAALVIGAALLVAAIGSAGAATRFVVRDEAGNALQRGWAVMLAPGRVGVPVAVFKHMGLWVKHDAARRTAEVFRKESDYGFGFRADSATALLYPGSPKTGRPGAETLPYRLAAQREGRFYVSARFMQEAFAEDFTLSVDRRTGTVTLTLLRRPVARATK